MSDPDPQNYTFSGLTGLDKKLARADERVQENGTRRREIFAEAERYLFDHNLDNKLWETFDTESDAHYFGVWLCRTHWRILTYAEGDISATQCDDADAYDNYLADLCDFHRPAPYMVTFGPEGRTAYYQDRQALFINPDRGAAYKFNAQAVAEDDQRIANNIETSTEN